MLRASRIFTATVVFVVIMITIRRTPPLHRIGRTSETVNEPPRDDIRYEPDDISDEEVEDLRDVIASEIMKYKDKPRPRYKFLLKPTAKSMKLLGIEKEGGWTAVTMVKSSLGNRDRRDAIRETWASQKLYNGSQFATIFILGYPRNDDDVQTKLVMAEHEKYGDILMLDIADIPSHVPDKSVAGMQWVADNLPNNWIYSSADDDISLHVPNFARYIDSIIKKYSAKHTTSRNSATNLPIMCVYSYQKKDPPARNPQSKWYMSEGLYPPEYWPPYCRGGWYSMSVGLAGEIFKISRWMDQLHLDDVWITGLMRIKYAASVSRNARNVMNKFLEAAPLSLRSDEELQKNLMEDQSDVIVSHAWGNIEGRRVDVAQKLRSDWTKWTS